MGANLQTYEVKVEVLKGKQSDGYNAGLGLHIFKKITKMFHIEARTPKQAKEKAEKHGRTLSVRKADPTMMYGNIEKLPLNQGVYQEAISPDSAIAQDEMIWLKRNKRIQHREKDKNNT